MTSSIRTYASRPHIELAPAEEKLTNLLREASSTKAFTDPDVVIRYAGGWVRDKILHKPSHDIDIAISSISGHEFAVQFAAFLGTHHPDLKTGTIAKILANPEKSKHLDTATSKFLTLDLDFVQLRTESYGATDSRTPSQVEVGTLEEDAERRDCTMNALYYNIHSMQVEDPTGKGLHDLAQGRIQTPLAPRKTFLDDPLRILRCIRFASQFGFEISEDTFQEMKAGEVRKALKEKVVKERVGIEVFKMMKGIDPPKALRALHSQGLYHIVFLNLPADASPSWFTFDLVEKCITLTQNSPALQRHLQEYYQDGRLWLVVSLLPYHAQTRPVPKKPELEEPLASSIIRDSLKLTSANEVLMKSVFPPRTINVDHTATPLELGKLVRYLKKDWKLVLLVSHITAADAPSTTESLVRLMDRIHELNLDKAWNFQAFIDGKKIKPLVTEAGVNIKVMKELVELVVEYRIENASITEDEALSKLREYLKTRRPNAEGW